MHETNFLYRINQHCLSFWCYLLFFYYFFGFVCISNKGPNKTLPPTDPNEVELLSCKTHMHQRCVIHLILQNLAKLALKVNNYSKFPAYIDIRSCDFYISNQQTQPYFWSNRSHYLFHLNSVCQFYRIDFT